MPYKDLNQRREYQRQWTAKRRSDFFKDKSCAVCGSKENLELDHIDPSLKIDHKIWNWAEERRLVEIAKCQILCEIHHLEKTISESSKPITHGTESGYSAHNYKCRCDLCRTAHAEYNRKLRASK